MWLYGIFPWILPFFKFSRNILCYLHITTVKIKVMYCFMIYGYSMYLLRWYTILDFTAFYCCYLAVFYRDFYTFFTVYIYHNMWGNKDKGGRYFSGLVPLDVAMTTAFSTSSGRRLSWPTGRGEQVHIQIIQYNFRDRYCIKR